MNCRHCNTKLQHVFLDLGASPPSNAYIVQTALKAPEVYYPLKLYVCDHCWLVQTEDYSKADELFSEDYAYFSSVSKSWLEHASKYCDMITDRLGLNQDSFVIEVASNDGYLLKNFVAAGIPCLGVEPTDSTADAAEKLGIPVKREFFGEALAEQLKAEGKQADLILGNNVYAHVPDINDFTKGLKIALKPGGTITLEFPHLMRLLEFNQFDTVYHEHYSYLSLYTVQKIFEAVGLIVYDVEEIPTHGGSIRVFGGHKEDNWEISPNVKVLLGEEEARGMRSLAAYTDFQEKADKIKFSFLEFLLEQRKNNKVVAAYGAAAKGNTLLNFSGVYNDLISFVCDAAPSKQGKYLPGSHIPILSPKALEENKPDWIIIFPWNISEEVKEQLTYCKDWGAQFVVAIPDVEVVA